MDVDGEDKNPKPDYLYNDPEAAHYHNENAIDVLKYVYIIALIAWFIIIYVFKFYKTDIFGIILLLIPVVVFVINFSNLEYHTVEMERELFNGNFVYLIFIVAAILINWSQTKIKKRVINAIVLSIFLILGSAIDIWTKPENFIIVKHIRTIFETVALVVVAYSLYLHYSVELRSEKYNPESKQW